MPRLIDADTLKAVFEEKSSVAVCGAKLCKAIISRIDEEPTVDAVPIDWIEDWCLSQDLEYVRIAIKKMMYNWKAEREEE